jgi:hypothetical protein
METTDCLVNFSREFCMQKCDMDIYFEILNISAYLASNFGIYATISSLPQVAFQDTDLNVGSLASLLVRLIVQKTDETEVNLMGNSSKRKPTATLMGNSFKAHQAFAR